VEDGLRLQTRRELLQHVIPHYRKASTVKRKSKLLDAFTAATGYNRKYAIWLLNHAKEVQSPPERQHPRHYGPEVQHALFLVWNAANRICAKRLIPFLPTLLEALERHEHLHLTEECRSQLLSMSAATAETFSGSYSAAPRDAISHYKSARESRDIRKIRAYLMEIREEHWQEEVIQGPLSSPVAARCPTRIF